VLDLRSSAYAGAWVPSDSRRVVTVRVVQERMVDGAPVRAVVSHFNKTTKGRLVRDLLVAGAQPRTPSALITALTDLGYTVETPAPRQVDVVVTDL
jgi:cytoplasmic iron level regulating protein YaaA (DUF328/UPF0246 family)